MLWGITLLVVWAALWVGSALVLGKVTRSKILSIGGGFIAGVLGVGLVAGILGSGQKHDEQQATRSSDRQLNAVQAEPAEPAKPAERRQQNSDEKAAQDALCAKDLQCWGDKHSVAAGVLCKRPIEALAKFSYKWTDGMFGLKFSRFRWLDRGSGTLTFIGDKIEMQNQYSAWQPQIYECDMDPKSRTVLAVRAKPGRL
jgi:hypothetical protein